MIFGYKTNYGPTQWRKTILSLIVFGLFLTGYVHIAVSFLNVYLPWMSFFITQLSIAGIPPEIAAELTDKTTEIDAAVWLVKHGLVLVLMFGSAFLVVLYLGYVVTMRVASWVVNRLNLRPLMTLTFIKVKPSKLDPLINWFKEH